MSRDIEVTDFAPSRRKWQRPIEVPELQSLAQSEKECWQRRSIYKLPAFVTDVNETAYTPRVVSFGPYHYGNEKLKEMELHKERAKDRFLKRSKKDNNDCREALLEIIDEIIDAYDGLRSKLDNQEKKDAFLDIMIRDGIFMLEIFGDREQKALDYADNDPIFSEHGNFYIIPHIMRDMLLLENQIPMKVLRRLYGLLQVQEYDIDIKEDKITNTQVKDMMQTTWKWAQKITTKVEDAIEAVFKIFIQKEDAKQSKPGKDENEVSEPADEVVFKFFFSDKPPTATPANSLHILDMYRTVILGSKPTPKIQNKRKKQNDEIIGGEYIIRSAVELKEIGVKIEQSKITSIRSISFEDAYGKLFLPKIIVDDMTLPLYLNLIAFERFHVGAGKEVTSYTFFMDNIIDGKEDIKLLHGLGIIQNGIGSDKAAAHLFNSLSKDISLDPCSPLADVYDSVNAYSKRNMPKYLAAFYHKYFANPWTIIAFIAAIMYFVLSTIQTTYAVLDFHKQDNNTILIIEQAIK